MVPCSLNCRSNLKKKILISVTLKQAVVAVAVMAVVTVVTTAAVAAVVVVTTVAARVPE